MDKFKIKIKCKINGYFKTFYHEDISNQKNNEVMNVYAEHITDKISKAKVFYDKDEAERIGKLFDNDYHVSEVITIK